MCGGCDVGEVEVQQRHPWQTCVNTIVRYERHIWQTCKTNVPCPKGKPKVLICVPSYGTVGHCRSKLANLYLRRL